MSPSRDDVQSMVTALFTLAAGLDRARRQRKDAGALSLLQVIAGREGIRPSEIAELQLVHPSLVTRQVRELEDAGYALVAGDPADGRSWLVTLTPAGSDEMSRLQQVGLDRFALFVADWEPGEVRKLAALLDRLTESMVATGERERHAATNRERVRTRDRAGARDRVRTDDLAGTRDRVGASGRDGPTAEREPDGRAGEKERA
jgi:DNA-binding MarR family transcriptional regulator